MNSQGPSFQSSSLLHQMRWGQDHGAFDDQVGKALTRAYAVCPDDKVVCRLIQGRLAPLLKQHAMDELPVFKTARLSEGNIVLGKDAHGQAIRIPAEWFKAGVLILSNTGGGKTNAAQFWLIQVAALGVPVWLSESYKSQLRRLRPLFARLGLPFLILRSRDWKWNPLECHHDNLHLHLTTVTDLLVRVLGLPPRARSILVQALHELYVRFGNWNGCRDAFPTLFDLHTWIVKRSDLNAAAREALLDRLSALLVSLTPQCAAYRLGWSSADLARFNIDFEMRGASENAKQLLLESLLFSLFQGEVERGVANGPLQLCICFEDAQRFFDSSQNASLEIAPMDELAGIIRGTGISLWVIAQTAQGLSPRVLPNLATCIQGRLGCAADYAALGATMGLTAEQIQWAKLHQSPGWFIGQCAEGNWREPFLFNVPLLSLPDNVDDAEAAESLKPLNELRTVFADEFTHWQPHHYAEIKTAQSSVESLLNEAAYRFLAVVVAQPGKRSSDYAKLTGLSGKRAAEIRMQLIEAGFLRSHAVATGARGRTAIVLEPTDPGRSAVNEKGTTP